MNCDIIFGFLKELQKNNNREWFNQHKKQYKEAHKEFSELVYRINPLIHQFDKLISLNKENIHVFRIYRDVRFSANKDPYKTNMGAFIAPGAKSSSNAGYYIHLEPEKSFIGGGIYKPPADILKAIRNEIFYHPDEFLNIINEPVFKKNFGNLWDEDKLKRIPKDFPADYRHGELLKYKSYVTGHNIGDLVFCDPDIDKYIAGVFESMYPLNVFLNRAIEMAE